MKIYNRILLFTIGILLFCGIASGQAKFLPLKGKVMLVQEDGTTVPVKKAEIRKIRPDITTVLIEYTDSDGAFSTDAIVGIEQTLCVSAPNITPVCRSGVKPGTLDLVITVTKGNGGEKNPPPPNVDSFMGIKYGTSLDASRIITSAVNIGKIDETKSSRTRLVLSTSRLNYEIKKYEKMWSGTEKIIILSFTNDKLYQAKVYFPELVDESGAYNFMASLAKDFEKLYGENSLYEDEDTGELSVIWKVKQIQSRVYSTFISLEYDEDLNRLVLTFQDEKMTDIAEQKENAMSGAARISYLVGGKYYSEKRYDLAVTEYTKAINSYSEYTEAFHYRGHSYGVLKKYDLAVADFTSALKYEPERTDLMYDRAAIYFEWSTDKYDLAIADLNAALKIRFNEPKYYLLRAKILCAQGKKQLAAADEKEAVGFGGTVKEKCEQ